MDRNQWIDYVSNEKVETYIFKHKDDLVGFFELISHSEKKEVEIAYFGLLEEFQNKKLGSYLLSQAIKKSFKKILIEFGFIHVPWIIKML